MTLFSSLTNRIFAGSAVLVVLSIGVAVYRVNVSVTAQAEAELRSGLNEAASLVDEFSRAQFEGFVLEGGLIADLPTLKQAVLTGDPLTVQPIAEEYQREIKADVFVVLSRSDRVLARAGRVAPDLASVDRILAARPSSQDARWLFPYDGGVLQVAAIPMEPGPAPLGALIVGSSLDQAAAEHIRTLSNSDIVLASNSHIVLSTLPPGRAEGLEAYASRREIFEPELGGEQYVARVQPLNPPASPNGPIAIVLRSRTEHLTFLGRLRRDILATGLIAVLLATVVGYLLARTVTRPLRAITATMTEIAATGDLAHTVPRAGPWDDEDARMLGATFRRLTAALHRFQREAAQRERLSALGRLSTVIAHEVRNPLMIIKTAVRSLRRAPTPDAVDEAATSIEEEVTRLNRVVSDVLDFARPIAFDLAPADLVEIARAAAQAVQAGAADVGIEVGADAAEAPAVTDRERLRAVLVNLLTNAQHAVRARGSRLGDAGGLTRETPPPIQVTIRRAGDDRWQIAVADRGVGIAASDLARVFEPFFTTRRTGSGLGLAISRNIVDGLGGAIVIDSQLGAGTTVRLDLPAAPPHAEVVP
jgi:signal transduction histidine kinase